MSEKAQTVIYVVIKGYDHEGSTPVAAFMTRADAERLLGACRAYADSPLYPEDTNDDVAWEAAETAIAEWKRCHPAGPNNSDGDYYDITEIPMYASQEQT